jgi:glycopeptide antibiotics resistance protein
VLVRFFPLPLLAGLALLLGLLPILYRRTHRTGFLVGFSAFWLYLLAVCALTLFPLPLPASAETRAPLREILLRMNLIPLRYGTTPDGIFGLSPRTAFWQLGGNVLLTLPYGLFLRGLFSARLRDLPALALAPGLGIEMAQCGFSLLLGSNYRVVDINDVLLNTLGALIGYTIYRLGEALLRLFQPRSAGRA